MRLDRYTKNKIIEYASNFFARMQHTNPFPVIVEDVVPGITNPTYNTYLSCLPEHIRNALLVVLADKQYISVFDKNTCTALAITVPHPVTAENKKLRVAFNFAGELLPSCGYWSDAPFDFEYPEREKLIQWIYRAKEIDLDYKRCRSFIGNIVEYANTVGQLRTMFPDYVRMLPEHQQQHVAGMKKRSRLPAGIELDYLNEHRRFVAEKIALCLLLPEEKGKIWVK